VPRLALKQGFVTGAGSTASALVAPCQADKTFGASADGPTSSNRTVPKETFHRLTPEFLFAAIGIDQIQATRLAMFSDK